MYWQEQVQNILSKGMIRSSHDNNSKPWILPDEIYSASPCFNKVNFQAFQQSIPSQLNYLDLLLSRDLFSRITSLNDNQGTNIDDLLKLQSTVTDCSTLDIMSPKELIQLLSKQERKSFKVSTQGSKEEQSFIFTVQDFWKFLVYLQLHRMLQPPQPLFQLKNLPEFVVVPYLYDKMKQNNYIYFKPTEMDMNVLEILLEGLSEQASNMDIGSIALQLENNLSVFVRNPETMLMIAQCKTKSHTKMINFCAQAIAQKLLSYTNHQELNSVVRGLLTLTILTGDIQYVLESVKICSQKARKVDLKVGDLHALMLVLCQKCYEYKPAIVAAFKAIDTKCLKSYFVNAELPKVFDLPTSNLVWNGQDFFGLRRVDQKRTKLVKFDGSPDSPKFGQKLLSVDIPDLEEQPFCLTANQASINFYAQTTPTSRYENLPRNKVFYYDKLEECFDPLMAFAQNEVLNQGFVLLDINFSVQTRDEGGKAVAWVIFGEKEIYPANKGTRLNMVKKESDSSWENDLNNLGEQIKAAGSRYFRHCITNVKHDTDRKLMVLWTWEDVEFKETNNKLKFIICFAWADQISKIKDYCNNLIDCKLESVRITSEIGHNTVSSIVTSSAPGEKQLFDLGYEQMGGSYDSIIEEITIKRKDEFKVPNVCFSLCQRDIKQNDNKVILCATFRFESYFNTERKPLSKVFYENNLQSAIDAQMQFVNQEVLSKDYSLVDIGFTVQSQKEGGKAVAWILYGDKAHYPANPGKELNLMQNRIDDSSPVTKCFDWMRLNVKKAGNRFFKHCLSMTNPSKSNDITCAVWYWNDVSFKEETEIDLEWFQYTEWAQSFDQISSVCKNKGRILLDVKIAVTKELCLSSIVFLQGCSQKFVFNLCKDDHAGNFTEILTKFTAKLAINPTPNLVGLAMCPINMDQDEKKQTIFASYEELPLEKFSYSTETLELQTRTPFKQPEADKLVSVQAQNVDAMIIQSGSQFQFVSNQEFQPHLENPLFKKDELIAANLTSSKLLLQYNKHLIDYSIDDMKEASSHQRICKHVNVSELNERVSKLLLKCGSSDFMYIDSEVSDSITVFNESGDTKHYFFSKMQEGQPTSKLQNYVNELHSAYDTIIGFKMTTNEQNKLLIKSMFQHKSVQDDIQQQTKSSLPVVSCTIAGEELGGMLLDTLCHFHTLLQSQKMSLELAPLSLLFSPLTFNQSSSVLSLLLELVSDEGLNVASQLRVLKLFINHLLGLRQNGRKLDEVLSFDHEAALKLLQMHVNIETKVIGLEQGQFKLEAQKVLNDTKNHIIALMQEQLNVENQQKLQKFPVLLSKFSESTAEYYIRFDYDLPDSFIYQATQPIKLIQVKYYANNIDFHAIQFVFFNGVEKLETIRFGDDSNLRSYDIKNDRQWSRQYWYRNDNRWPFAQMNFRFDDNTQGITRSDVTSILYDKIEEKLTENEFISGFKGYTDKQCKYLRSICMKTSIIQKLKSVPSVFKLSKTQLDQITYSSPMMRAQLVLKLITARLPFSLTQSEEPADEFDKEMLQFICDNFTAVPGSQEFKIASDFLILIASMATKTENAVQLKTIHQLFRIVDAALIENFDLLKQKNVLNFTFEVCSNVLLLVKCSSLSDFAARFLQHLSIQQVDSERNNALANMNFFNLMASQACLKVQELLTTKPNPTCFVKDQEDENTKLLEILNQSGLFSGGFQQIHKRFYSERTLNEIEELKKFAEVKLVDDALIEQTEDNKICLAIIYQDQNSKVDDLIQALQLIVLKLPQTRMIAKQQGELGLKLTRSAFAVLVQFTGHLHSFVNLLYEIDKRHIFSAHDQQADRHQKIAKHIQEDKKLGQYLIETWIDATQMRGWLQQQKAVIAENVSSQYPKNEEQLTEEEQFGLSKEDTLAAKKHKSNEEESKVNKPKEEALQNRLTEVEAAIQEKACFLIQLNCPENFKSKTCNLETHLDLDLTAENPLHAQSTQEAFSDPSKKFSDQEKQVEIQKAGATQVLMCLQSGISVAQIQERVETNYLNAARRLVGLCLLNKFIKFVLSLSQASKMSSQVSGAMHSLCSCLQTNNEKQFHYLDGVSGCGSMMETQLRDTFFEIIEQLLRFQSTQPELNLLMISCLHWNYRANDFKYLLKLHVLKQLMWGADNFGIYAHFAEGSKLNWNVIDPVVKEHLLAPQDEKSKAMFYTFIDTVMQLIAKITEESNQQSELQASNSSLTIQGAKSVFVSSENATLIAQAFEIAFQELNLFLDLYRVLKKSNCTDRKSLVSELHRYKLGKTEDCDLDLEGLDEDEQKNVKLNARKFLEESENTRLQSLISLIVIFTSITSSSPHTIALLTELIHPDHVKTLIRLLIEVRPQLKINILAILQNLLRCKISSQVIATGIKDLQIFCSSDVAFTDPLADKLFSIALQLRNRETQSIQSQEVEGKYDYFVHLTRTIAACLAHQEQQTDSPYSKDLSDAFIKITSFSEVERDVLFHIMGAHHQRFVHNDRLINLRTQQVQVVNFKTALDIENLADCIVCPDSVMIAPRLSTQALEMLALCLQQTSETDSNSVLLKSNILKLLCLQSNAGNLGLSQESRRGLMEYLLAFREVDEKYQPQQTARYLELLCAFEEMLKFEDPFTLVTKSTKKGHETRNGQAKEDEPTINRTMDQKEPALKQESRWSGLIDERGMMLHEVYFGLLIKQADRETFERKVESFRKQLADFVELIKSYYRTLSIDQHNLALKLKEASIISWIEKGINKLQAKTKMNEIDAALNSIEFSQVSGLLGPKIQALLTVIDVTRPSRSLMTQDYKKSLLKALDLKVEVSNFAAAQKLVASKQTGYDRITFKPEINRQLSEDFAKWDIKKQLEFLEKTRMHESIEIVPINGSKLNSKRHPHQLTGMSGNGWGCDEGRAPKLCLSGRDNRDKRIATKEGFWRYSCKEGRCGYDMCILCCKGEIFIEQITNAYLKDNFTDLVQVGITLNKKLASKLLLKMIDADQDFTSTNNTFGVQFRSKFDLADALIDVYDQTATELRHNTADCIWDCHFASTDGKQLVCRGTKVNFHEIVSSLTFPSVQALQFKVQCIIDGLLQTELGKEIVFRLFTCILKADIKETNIYKVSTLWITQLTKSAVLADDLLVIKLPELFEALLATLGNDNEPFQVRLIIEQCQTILQIAYDNPKLLKGGPLQLLLNSPLLDTCLGMANKQFDNSQKLLPLMLADMRVQQIELFRKIDQVPRFKKLLEKQVTPGVTCDQGDILTLRTTPRTRAPFNNQSVLYCSVCDKPIQRNRCYYTCCYGDTDCDFSCCMFCFKGNKALLLTNKIKCDEGLALTLRTDARQRPEYYGTSTVSCSVCFNSIKCNDGYYTCENADLGMGCNFDCCQSCYNTSRIYGVICDNGDPLVARISPGSRAPFDGKVAVDCNLCKRTITSSELYFACCNADTSCDFSCCRDCFQGFSTYEGIMQDRMPTCVQDLMLTRTPQDDIETFAGKKQFIEVFCKIPKDEVTPSNWEELLAKSKYSWPKFLNSYHAALTSQFALDVLDTINKFLFSRNIHFLNLPVEELEFKGDRFATEFDQMLAQIVAIKLISFNKMYLKNEKLYQVFDTDPLSFISHGIGKHQTCRNWKKIIDSKKHFLVDQLLTQLFKHSDSNESDAKKPEGSASDDPGNAASRKRRGSSSSDSYDSDDSDDAASRRRSRSSYSDSDDSDNE